jgi:hypothetical protein
MCYIGFWHPQKIEKRKKPTPKKWASPNGRAMTFEDMIVTTFRLAAVQRALALEAKYAQLVEQERLELMWAAQDKTSMPANYWHERHKVGEMARTARRIAELLK